MIGVPFPAVNVDPPDLFSGSRESRAPCRHIVQGRVMPRAASLGLNQRREAEETISSKSGKNKESSTINSSQPPKEIPDTKRSIRPWRFRAKPGMDVRTDQIRASREGMVFLVDW